MPQSKRNTIPIIAVCLTLLVCFTVNTQIANAQENIVLTDANPDTTITTGSTATVYGSAGANHVTIESGAYVMLVNFPGSNTITIKSDSSNFTVSRSGATVTFQGADVQGSGGGTVIKIPATKTVQKIIFNDLSKELVISNNKVMLELDEVTVEPSAIRPVAGILSLFINSESNQLSGFVGNAVEAKITIISDSQDNIFSFEIEDGPAGMAVSSEGVITYTIPADAQVETSTPFKVRVLNTVSNESVTLDGSIYVMKAVEIGSGTVTTQGGTVTAQTEGVSVEIPAGAVSQNVQVKIIQGQDGSGRNLLDLKVDGVINGTFNVTLPDPNSFYNSNRTRNREHKSSRSSSNYPLKEEWTVNQDGQAKFSSSNDSRLPNDVRQFPVTQSELVDIFPFSSDKAYSLKCSKSEDSAALEGEPVLFIHGYTAGNNLGGGNGTWGDFPALIEKMSSGEKKYISFEFQWKTNARFEDVADDLGLSLKKIKEKTNKNIHIIAHSFGGILTRTLLQKLNADGENYSSYVSSVTTLGTPHSGIFDGVTPLNLDGKTTLDNVTFLGGQDSTLFEGAGQISVHQMGEKVKFVSQFHNILQVDPVEGKLAAKLADTVNNFLPAGLPFQVGIGLTTKEYNNDSYKVDEGDNLITYEGQRFHPDLTNNGIKDLLYDYTGYGGKITEFVLGFLSEYIPLPGIPNPNEDIRPGNANNKSIMGYSHTGGTYNFPSEAYVTCSDPATCTHASYLAVKDWLDKYSQISEEYLTTGLVAYYPFNGNANDESGNNNNGVIYGNPLFEAGIKGDSLHFNTNTSDDYIKINGLSIDSKPLTIVAWVKPDYRYDYDKGSNNGFASKYPNNVVSGDRLGYGGYGFGLNFRGDMDKLEFQIETHNGTAHQLIELLEYDPSVFHFIAVVYDTNEARAYRGSSLGIPLASSVIPNDGLLDGNKDYTLIGRHNFDVNWDIRTSFNGCIDEVRIYNRVLSEAEIRQLYLEQ